MLVQNMHRLNRLWVFLAWLACSVQTAVAAPHSIEFVRTPPLHPDAARFRQLHEQGVQLRHQFNDVHDASRQGPKVTDELRMEYASLQAGLSNLVRTHRLAMLTAQGESGGPPPLLHSSLVVMASSELLANFHTLAAVRNAWPDVSAGWNHRNPLTALQEVGPAAVSTQDEAQQRRRLFKTALHSLRQIQSELESRWVEHDQDIRALYPIGVEEGLRHAEQQLALLLAGMGEEDLGQDLQALQALIEQSTQARQRWANIAAALEADIIDEGGIIRGGSHVRIHTVEETYLGLRRDLHRLAFKHLPKLSRQDIPYQNAFRLRAIGLSLLAAKTLSDNADCLRSHFVVIPGIRSLLNQGDPARQIPSAFWDQVEREFARPGHRVFVNAGLTTIQEALSRAEKAGVAGDRFLIEVLHQAASSTDWGERQQADALTRGVRVFNHYRNRLHQFEASLFPSITFNLSKLFGNVIGLVEFRKGKLFGNMEWTQFVRARLQPGDLLLERTPFRLTDAFIPGQFGHVALYVGTEDELRAMGLLDHPLVVSHIQKIRAGRTIVEALRDGTQINTVEHFLNVDDLAILRPKSEAIDQEDVKRAITLAFSHIGKTYDFGFDTSTWDRITCSELAFDTYVNVRWPFGKLGNAFTITPDDVASMAGSHPSQPFELVTVIHDGQVVHDQPSGLLSKESYAQVLGERKKPTGYGAWVRE
ncbi:MAG: YiiX/YebB-like N1pC/P60 family cysteine hydrolase [Nitrospiraceae bacterium]